MAKLPAPQIWIDVEYRDGSKVYLVRDQDGTTVARLTPKDEAMNALLDMTMRPLTESDHQAWVLQKRIRCLETEVSVLQKQLAQQMSAPKKCEHEETIRSLQASIQKWRTLALAGC